jgi:hypothetical protein
MYRPIIILNSTAKSEEERIIKYNIESTKPPIILGVYEYQQQLIFTPYFYNKNLEFSIDSLKGKVEIIAYLAKSVPSAFQSRSILDMEVYAILTALHSLQRYISNTKCHLLTDSRVLYYLFNQQVGNSSTKIKRWVLKLISDYPQVTLHFVRTTENLADYLTRQGLPKGDLEKLNLKNIEVKDFYDKLPKIEYSLREWAQFCQDNPQYLTTTVPTVNLMSLSLTTAIKNVSRQVEPLMLLKRKLSKENIINEQHRQYNSLIQEISALERKKQPLRKGNLIYLMEWDVLYVSHTTDGVPEQEKQNKANLLRQQILLPDSLVGILLSFIHLQGHYGTEKMLVNMQDFYFPNMYQITKQFVGSCYSCFLQNPSSRRNVLGIYLTPDRVFQEVSMDLAENLNTIRGMSHLLICQDVLSDIS